MSCTLLLLLLLCTSGLRDALTDCFERTRRHAFGLAPCAGDAPSLAYLDERTLVYLIGSRVVFHEKESHTMTFVEHPPHARVQAFCLSPSRRYLAALELQPVAADAKPGGARQRRPSKVEQVMRTDASDHSVSIGIYSAGQGKPLKRLSHADFAATPAWPPVMEFSHDSRSLAIVMGPPAHSLLVFAWERQKALPRLGLFDGVSRLAFCPFESQALLTLSPQNIRLHRVVQDELRTLPVLFPAAGSAGASEGLALEPGSVFVDAAWLHGDSFAVATDRGSVFIFEAAECVRAFHSLFSSGISCLVAAHTTVIVASRAMQWRALVESVRNSAHELRPYTVSCPFETSRYDDCVVRMAMAPTGRELVCLLGSAQLLTVALAAVAPEQQADEDDDDAAAAAAAADFSPDPALFSLVGAGAHSGAVLSLDVCSRKPLVVSCATDRTVRVWSYVERACVGKQRFRDEPLSVAFHPLGLQIAVAFVDAVSIMSVLAESFRLEHALAVRAVHTMAFSAAGAYLALASGTEILIFRCTVYDQIGSLAGHLRSVQSLAWLRNDLALASVALDGSVFVWALESMRARHEASFRDVSLTAVVASSCEDDSIVVATTERLLKHIVAGAAVRDFRSGPHNLQTLAHHPTASLVFGASAEGLLRVVDVPFNALQRLPSPLFRLNSKQAITCMRFSPDGSLLFTAGDRGTIFVQSVRLVDEASGALAPWQAPQPDNFSDLVLISSQQLREQRLHVRDLKARIAESELHAHYAAKQEARRFEARLADTLAVERKREAEQKAMYAELQAIHETRTRQFQAEQAEQARAHEAALQAIVSKSRLEAERQAERYEALSREYHDALTAAEDNADKARQQHRSVLAQMRSEFETTLREHTDAFDRLVHQMETNEREHAEIIRQISLEHDDEVLSSRAETRKLADAAKATAAAITDDRALLRIQQADMAKEKQVMADANAKLRAKLAEREHELAEARKQLALLRVSVQERDEIIADKELRILETKKRNQDLEKYKFVLDYKNQELSKELEPKESAIVEMAQRLNDIDDELQRNVKEVENLTILLREREERIRMLQSELAKAGQAARSTARLVASFERDVEALYTRTESSAWREGVRALYATYVSKDLSAARTGESAASLATEEQRTAEFARQRAYMETSIHRLRHQQDLQRSLKDAEISRRLAENHTLVTQLNELRRDNITLRKSSRTPGSGGVRSAGSESAGAGTGAATTTSSGDEAVAGVVRAGLDAMRERAGAPAGTSAGRQSTSEVVLPPPDTLLPVRRPATSASFYDRNRLSSTSPISPAVAGRGAKRARVGRGGTTRPMTAAAGSGRRSLSGTWQAPS